MASKTVFDAVRAMFAGQTFTASFNGAPLTLPVYGPNEQGEAPQDGSPFIAFEFPLQIPSEQVTIGSPGSNVIREHGALQVTIAAQRTGGVDAGLAIADQIAALFRNVTSGGVRFWLPSPPASGDRNEDGNFYKLSISCPYWSDTLG